MSKNKGGFTVVDFEGVGGGGDLEGGARLKLV